MCENGWNEGGSLVLMETQEQVILVDEQDREVGASEKLRAHREGALHRAFSVFVLAPRSTVSATSLPVFP